MPKPKVHARPARAAVIRPNHAPDTTTIAMFLLTATFVGSNFVAIRFSNMELDPFWGAGLRFVPACLILLAIMALWRIPMPTGKALIGAIMFGLLGFGGFFAFVYWGLLEATAATGAIVLSSVPLMTFLFSWLHGTEPFRGTRLAGALLVIAGIVLLVVLQPRTEAGATPLSILALVAAALCVSEAAVLLKRSPPVHPVAVNMIATGTGALFLLLLSLLAQEAWQPPRHRDTWIAVGYLTLLGTVALFFMYVSLIQKWGPSATVYVLVASPLVAVIAGVVLAGEPVTWVMAASGVLIIAGVYVGVLRKAADKR